MQNVQGYTSKTRRPLFASSFSIYMTVPLQALQLVIISRNFNFQFSKFFTVTMLWENVKFVLFVMFFRSNLPDWLTENIQCLSGEQNKKCDLLAVLIFIKIYAKNLDLFYVDFIQAKCYESFVLVKYLNLKTLFLVAYGFL